MAVDTISAIYGPSKKVALPAVLMRDVRGANNDPLWASNWRRGQGATTKAYQRYVEEE